jgi:hypothetical protein
MAAPGALLKWVLCLAFAAAVGHVAWYALAGPPPAPDYFLEAEGPTLSGPDPARKELYLRRKLFLPAQPRHAWIEAIGRDRVHVYVNGQKAGDKVRDGFPVGVVADITGLLHPGVNVLAVRAEQSSFGHSPAVAIRGAYYLGAEEYPIPGDASWLCNPAGGRGAGPWYSAEFDDSGWAHAEVSRRRLRGSVDGPPRARTEPGWGRWISPAALTARQAAFRGEVEVPGRPAQAWLRVAATTDYSLAVNGVLLDAPEDELGTDRPAPAVQHVYDITPLMHRGKNVVALRLGGGIGQLPQLLAELEAEDTSGARHRLGTDGHWLSRPGAAADWSAPAVEDPAAWQPAAEEAGEPHPPPWPPVRKMVVAGLPAALVLERLAGQAALIALVAVLTAVGCALAGRLLSRRDPDAARAGPAALAYLALLPPALALGAALLATYDPRVARQEVYRPLWVVLAVASVPLQWALLALAAGRPALRLPRPALPRVGAAVLLGLLVAAGFWLRLGQMNAENLMQDEVHSYDATLGIFERGFPSHQADPHMPVKYWSATELCFPARALVALATDEPHWVMRFPQIVCGTLVIALIWLVGRRMFSPAVGWLAAAVYAFSPVCIAMSGIGRYFEQTQLFALLTVYLFWLALRGQGPVSRTYVWLTAGCFVLTYLSWEGAALLAPGMMLAALVLRRGRVATVLGSGTVWLGLATVLSAILLQNAHQMFQASHRLRYGTAAGAITVAPMWLYASFDPWYYVREATWNPDIFIPLVGLALAGVLAVRHAWRERFRFLLLIHLTGCLILAGLVSVKASRYVHHQTPLLILLATAAFVACARALARAVPASGPAAWRGYAAAVAALPVLAAVVLGSGFTVQLSRMDRLHAQAYGLTLYKFPAVEGAVRYLCRHAREGDVVLATASHQVNHMMSRAPGARPGLSADYFLEIFPPLEELTDTSPVPLEHRSGSRVVSTRQELEDVFARHGRVWYVANTNSFWSDNALAAYARDSMEIVYEDLGTLVLFRGEQHWTAEQQASEPPLISPRGNPMPSSLSARPRAPADDQAGQPGGTPGAGPAPDRPAGAAPAGRNP